KSADRFVRYPGEQDLLVALLLVEAAGRAVANGRITVKEGEQCNLLAGRLQLRCDRMRHEAAEGPAEQVVGPDRLNLTNETQIVRRYLLQSAGENVWLQQAARLQPINRTIGWDMREESGKRPTNSSGMVDAEQRSFAALAPDRQQSFKIGL